MGKTYRDLKEFDKARNKENSRKVFKDADMRTRVKPLSKQGKGGGKNWRNELDSWLEEDYDNDEGGLHEN